MLRAAVCAAGGTFALLQSFLPLKCGVSVTLVNIADLDAVRAAITPRTKVGCVLISICPVLLYIPIFNYTSLCRFAGFCNLPLWRGVYLVLFKVPRSSYNSQPMHRWA